MDKESEERKSDQLVGQILHKVDKFKEFLQENSPFIDDSHTEFLAGAIGILSVSQLSNALSKRNFQVLCLIMLYIQCSKKVINYKTAEPSARISYKRRLLRSFKKHKSKILKPWEN